MFVLFRRWLAGSPVLKRRRVVRDTFGRIALRSESMRSRGRSVVFLMAFLFQPGTGPEFKQVRRVAIFYELGLSSPAVALADREIRAVLDSSPYQIELYPE